jgi:hypothetical protein
VYDMRGSIHSMQAARGRNASRRAVDSTAAIRSRSEATGHRPRAQCLGHLANVAEYAHQIVRFQGHDAWL